MQTHKIHQHNFNKQRRKSLWLCIHFNWSSD